MSKCLRIIISINIVENLLQEYIQKNAKKLGLEGTAQLINDKNIRIYICGPNEKVNEFLDSLYKGYKDNKPEYIEVEPFLKERDYRGVFRVIE